MSSLPWKRLLIGAVVVLALSLLVWFVGPLIAVGHPRLLESGRRRWLIIFLFLLVWAAIELTRVLLEKRRNKKMLSELANTGEEESLSRLEADQLSQRFSTALDVLKTTKFGGQSGGKLLYQLPWYMFIGAPGSGKTTALVNCGLRFPLAQPGSQASAVGGIGGTRNCDWWFTDRAVLIDTAGRYTTQDSNANVDKRAWTTFLQLLKKYRPRQPISGILVTLSVSDLLSFAPDERQRYAQVVRQRVDELQRDLGLQFPVYVLVTKCDLIAGFSEFYSTFDADQRAQVWGITFDLDLRTRQAANPRETFDREFPPLLTKLNDLLLARMQEERDAERRTAMYPFPQQFAAVGPLVSEFLAAAFSDSNFNEKALVRGVYFTSGTQQGAPIDRLLGSLARTLDIPATAAAGGARGGMFAGGAAKSFFLTRLMSEVIFPEAGLAGYSEQREKRLRVLNWAMVSVAFLLAGGLVTAWTFSYFSNKQGLARAGDSAKQAKTAVAQVGPPAPADLAVLVSALNSVRAIPPAVNDPVRDPPLRMSWGLYQGEKVDDQVAERYRTALQQGLLPRIAMHLEAIMAAPTVKPEAVYAALKAYLMMYESKRLDQPFFLATVGELWSSAGVDRDLLSAAREHLIELVRAQDLQVARFHPLDEKVVAAARDRVASASMVDRAYSLLRLSGQAAGSGLRLSEVVGPAGVGVLQRASGVSLADPIDGIFTREGYLKAVRPRIGQLVSELAREEAWVMGPRSSGVGAGANTKELESAVLQRFLADYRATWEGVMRDVQVRRVDGLRSATTVAQVLGQPDSPLKRLVQAVAAQTRLQPSAGDTSAAATSAASEEARRKLRDAAASATSGLFGSQAQNVVGTVVPAGDPLRAQEIAFEEQFAGLRRLAGDGKGGPAEIDAAIAVFNEIFNELVAMQNKPPGGLKEVPQGLARAQAQADRFGPPVSGVIKALTNYAQQEATGAVKNEVATGVNSAASSCLRSVSGRYPFVHGSQQDTGVQDFVNVFKAGGELDSFFNSNLAQYVDKSGGVWRIKGGGEGPVSAGTLRQFQNADAIRTAFLNGGAAPSVTVDVAVVSGDGEVTLEYDGNVQKLRTGSGTARLTWPAKPNAKLSINGQPVVSVEGNWALFRLVDKGAMDPASTGDRIRVNYATPSGARAQLELRTGSAAYNPFRLRELETFACPKQ